MFLRGFRLNRCPITNLYEATTFSMWALVAIYLVIGLWSRLRFLGAFASPFLFGIGIFGLMPGLDVASAGAALEVPGWLVSLHAAIMALAYGAFGLSSVAAVMYLTQERDLKMHKLKAVISLMPPIQRLELAVGRLMVAGFVLLTLGLLVGLMGFKHLANPGAYRGDPKVVWSAVVWLVYLGLIVMRWRYWQGGRRFALGSIGTFAFILLTFWGSNLLSPLHNP
jgi:ABC-type uncharacterized transport system permease subunit